MPIYTSQINAYLAQQQQQAMVQQQQRMMQWQQQQAAFVRPPSAGSIGGALVKGSVLAGGIGAGMIFNRATKLDGLGMAFKGVKGLATGVEGAGATLMGGMGLIGAGMALWSAADMVADQFGRGGGLYNQAYNTMAGFQFRGQQGVTRQQGVGLFREMQGLSSELGTTTEDMGRLMSQFRSMGAMKGVQTAREFRMKFRELTHTAAQMARELGQSINEAAVTMAQIRSLGFRSGGDQRIAARGISQARWATGMSVGQVLQAQHGGAALAHAMGTHMWRGAMGTTAALSTFGAGVNTGFFPRGLLEEATGVTGARAIQQMAAISQRALGGRLMSRFGRYYLAAAATDDMRGIDPERLYGLIHGGMDISEIKRTARHRVYGREGREMHAADRVLMHEEDWRGRILQEGPMALAGMIRSELGGRLYDVEDYRVNRTIRRKFGLNKRQSDVMLRMARNYDEMMGNIFAEEERRQYFQQPGQMHAKTAFKRMLAKFKKGIVDPIQEIGAVAESKLQEWSDQLNRAIDKAALSIMNVKRRTRHAPAYMGTGATAYWGGKVTLGGIGGGGYSAGGGNALLWNRLGTTRQGLVSRVKSSGLSAAIETAAYSPEVLQARASGDSWAAQLAMQRNLKSQGFDLYGQYGQEGGSVLKFAAGVSGAAGATGFLRSEKEYLEDAVPFFSGGVDKRWDSVENLINNNELLAKYSGHKSVKELFLSKVSGKLSEMEGSAQAARHLREAEKLYSKSGFSESPRGGMTRYTGAAWMTAYSSAKRELSSAKTRMMRAMKFVTSDSQLGTLIVQASQASPESAEKLKRKAVDIILKRKDLKPAMKRDLIGLFGTAWDVVKQELPEAVLDSYRKQAEQAIQGRMERFGSLYTRKNLGAVVAGRFGSEAASAMQELIQSGNFEDISGGMAHLVENLSGEQLQKLGRFIGAHGGVGGETIAGGVFAAARIKSTLLGGKSHRLSTEKFTRVFGELYGAHWGAGSQKQKAAARNLWNKGTWSDEDAQKFIGIMKEEIGEDKAKEIAQARMDAGGKVTKDLVNQMAERAASKALVGGFGTTNRDMMEKGSQAKYFGSGPGIHAELKTQTTLLTIMVASNKDIKGHMKDMVKKIQGAYVNGPSSGKKD